MAKSLSEYVDFIHGRDPLWPKPVAVDPPKATPYVKPLPGIAAVTWSVYGTLIRIADGELLFDHPQKLRMQVALEKTIEEFKMWNSMFRTPEKPWEYMHRQFRDALDAAQLAGTGRKGDLPAIDSSTIWRKLIAQLEQKDYQYDREELGDPDDLSTKVAYFFHAKLQGAEATPNALQALAAVGRSGVRQGLLADAQPFTLPQLLFLLKEQGPLPPLGELFAPDCLTLSYQVGCRKPSPSLFEDAVRRFAEREIEPDRVLHVSSRIEDDLATARKYGLRTALYAGDKLGLRATKDELRDPKTKPDRLLTDLAQIREILRIPEKG